MSTTLSSRLRESIASKVLKKHDDSCKGEEFEEVECRICLETSDSQNICQPCICSGSLSQVHQKCLKQWILATIVRSPPKNRADIIQKGMKCEVCKYRMRFQLEQKNILTTKEQFCKAVQQDRMRFIFMLGMLLIMVAGFILVGIFIMSNPINFKDQQAAPTSIAILVALSILVIMFPINLYSFIFSYLLASEYQISQIILPNQKPQSHKALQQGQLLTPVPASTGNLLIVEPQNMRNSLQAIQNQRPDDTDQMALQVANNTYLHQPQSQQPWGLTVEELQ